MLQSNGSATPKLLFLNLSITASRFGGDNSRSCFFNPPYFWNRYF